MALPEIKTPRPSELGGKKGTRGEETDFLRRLNRYGNAKSHTQSVMAAIGQKSAVALGLRWEQINECGSWLRFRDYFTVGTIKLAGANFCKKHLVCSLCAIRRASKLMAVYLERFQSICATSPGTTAHLATLTVRNSHDLAACLDHLLRSLRLLHRRRNNKRQPSIMHSVDAGVYVVELTHDAATGWHPHVHAIWLSCDPSMSEQTATFRLRSEWESITVDSFMCDVRTIEAKTDLPDDIDPHAGGFAEVFKYAMKPSELGPERLAEALPVLLGRRLAGSFGDFRGVPEVSDYGDDLRAFHGLPYEEFLAHYVAGSYRRTPTRYLYSGPGSYDE